MIFVVSHKEAPLLSECPEGYSALFVGNNKDRLSRSYPEGARDDIGESIAELNPYFCELTGIYWIWKNVNDGIKGIVHYRRYFAGNAGDAEMQQPVSYDSVEALLQEYDCILPEARPLLQSVKRDYNRHQVSSDLDCLSDAVKKLEPSYSKSFDDCMNGRYIHAYNMLIARKDVFDAYCTWLFPLLFYVWERIDISGRDSYKQRAIGFLSERLLDVWLPVAGYSWHELPLVQPEMGAKEKFSLAVASLTAGHRPDQMKI